jgi:homotetrameric cytidine deaminase
MVMAGVRLNVELKARCADLELAAERCASIGAAEQGALEQRDTYFSTVRGRLKLRVLGSGTSELLAYQRADDPEATESAYLLVPVPAPHELSEALVAALGEPLGVVSKRRRLFLYEGVRIHLDDVDGLGSFIEFEAVMPDAGNIDAARAKVARLRTELEIADEDLVPVSYADLLLDEPDALLRAADAAMRNAYAPYSQFRVGAAVRAPSGGIYAGANVENVAYPQGACAESAALGALITAGEGAITAVAVVADRADRCPPCGGCRQRLAEFGGPETPVYLGRPGEPFDTITLGELLPGAFGREELNG